MPRETTDAVFVVVSTARRETAARSTVRSLAEPADGRCLVVDVDGGYRPAGAERVVSLVALPQDDSERAQLARAAATLDEQELLLFAAASGAAHVLRKGQGPAVVLGAGVVVVGDLDLLLGPLPPGLSGVVVGSDGQSLREQASAAPLAVRRDPQHGLELPVAAAATGRLSRAVFALGSAEDAELLRSSSADWTAAPTALETLAVTRHAHHLPDHVLVSPWRRVDLAASPGGGGLDTDGGRVALVDLTALDPDRPWVMAEGPGLRVLLSDHPALAEVVGSEAAARIADRAVLSEESAPPRPRERWDAVLRGEARRTTEAGGVLPDLVGDVSGAGLEEWALALVPQGDLLPVARYLGAVHQARADLRQAFPAVPGRQAAGLARWALDSGVHEAPFDRDLLRRAAERTRQAHADRRAADQEVRPPGVNLVGYLSGELGVGTSARLVDEALQAVGVPTSTFDVSRDIASRRGARFRASDPVVHDTTLICVNGAETAQLVPRLGPLVKRNRVIGMWYWELADFPSGHHVGFEHVDEVWAATDFVRDAIAAHAGDVPVRTVTPPLPQAGDDPGEVPSRFGIPCDRPWFLFTFDHLSVAERKNPLGLVSAFSAAFGDRPPDQRPVLVIKTINADRVPDDAERLRLEVAGRPDVVLVEDYLDDHERHVLVSHCTAYVSLHRAEGLGLTVAEAMAWGKPVVTTAYGGVMQFCDESNALLVDWAPGAVTRDAGPYTVGMSWAEPDLVHASRLIRSVVDEPERAARIGAKAARDVRELHTPAVAGRRMREALAEGDAVWRARQEGQLPDQERSSPARPPTVEGIGRLLRRGSRRRS